MAILIGCKLVERLRAGYEVDNLSTDEHGQVIVHTGVYRWRDGSYNDCREDSSEVKEAVELSHTD